MVTDERLRPSVTKILKELEAWKSIAKASGILDGTFYQAKKSGFWGFMKKVFTGDDEEEEDQLQEESQGYYFLPVLLEQTINSILKYICQKSITPLITAKRFNHLL